MIEVKNERFDPETNEYVYDVEMSDEELATFKRLADEAGVTVEEYCARCVEYAIEHPEELERILKEEEKESS